MSCISSRTEWRGTGKMLLNPGLWATTHLKGAVPYQAEGTSTSLVPFFLNFRPPLFPFMLLLPSNFSSMQLHIHTFLTSVILSDLKAIVMPFYCQLLPSWSQVQIPTQQFPSCWQIAGILRLSHEEKTKQNK